MAADPNSDKNTPALTEAELAEFAELAGAGVQEVRMGDRSIRMASLDQIRKAQDGAKARKKGSRSHRAAFSKSVHRTD